MDMVSFSGVALEPQNHTTDYAQEVPYRIQHIHDCNVFVRYCVFPWLIANSSVWKGRQLCSVYMWYNSNRLTCHQKVAIYKHKQEFQQVRGGSVQTLVCTGTSETLTAPFALGTYRVLDLVWMLHNFSRKAPERCTRCWANLYWSGPATWIIQSWPQCVTLSTIQRSGWKRMRAAKNNARPFRAFP